MIYKQRGKNSKFYYETGDLSQICHTKEEWLEIDAGATFIAWDAYFEDTNALIDNNKYITVQSDPPLRLNRTQIAQKSHTSFTVDDIREFIKPLGYKYWHIKDLDYEFGITSEIDGKHYRRRAIGYLLEQGEIEQHPTRANTFRAIDQNDFIDYKGVSPHSPVGIWLPFDIHKNFSAYAGNVLSFAGVTDSGKTALAVNIIRNNDDNWEIDYFTNELSAEELTDRLLNLEPEKPIEDWNFQARPLTPGYLSKIRPNVLSLFDYLDVGDPYYRIAEEHQAIRTAIEDGVAITFLQKDDSKLLGRGRGFSAQLPRLYISMSLNSAYAYKAKTPKNPLNPLKGKTCDFTLKNGVNFTFTQWRYKNLDEGG